MPWWHKKPKGYSGIPTRDSVAILLNNDSTASKMKAVLPLVYWLTAASDCSSNMGPWQLRSSHAIGYKHKLANVLNEEFNYIFHLNEDG